MKLAAIIIETRSIWNIDDIIKKHMDKLPPETDLHWYTHPNAPTKDLEKSKQEGKIFINRVNDMSSIGEYNGLLTSTLFWEFFTKYDRVVVFQSDSMLLKRGIEDFYEYDYVGAPWKWNTDYAGNGGLSLRNPKVMLEVCQRFKWNGSLNEDHWICMHMHDHQVGKLAPIEVAEKFSTEALFRLGTLGYHGIEKWLSKEECEQIKNQYK